VAITVTIENLQGIGTAIESNTMKTLFQLASNYDQFQKPLIYLAYQNDVSGYPSLRDTPASKLYEMAAKSDRDFINQAFNYSTQRAPMAKNLSTYLTAFPPLTETQIYHLSPSYFVTYMLKNKTHHQPSFDAPVAHINPTISNYLTGAKYMQTKLKFSEMVAVYGKTTSQLMHRTLGDILQELQGTSLDDLALIYNYTKDAYNVTIRELVNLGVAIDGLSASQLPKLTPLIPRFHQPIVWLSYKAGIIGRSQVEDRTVYQLYQLVTGWVAADVDLYFNFTQEKKDAMSSKLFTVFKLGASFTPLRDQQGEHMSPLYVVQSVLANNFNENRTLANYMKGVEFIHSTVPMKDVIKMYETTMDAVLANNFVNLVDTFHRLSQIQLGDLHHLTTNDISKLQTVTVSKVKDLGITIREAIMQVLIKVTVNYDNFNIPAIWLSYKNSIIGYSKVYGQSLYELYQLASGQSVQVIDGLWSITTAGQKGIMQTKMFKQGNNFPPIAGDQVAHLSSNFLVQNALIKNFNQTLTVQNFIEGVTFIHTEVVMSDFRKMYEISSARMMTMNLVALTEETSSATSEQLAQIHSLTPTQAARLNGVTVQDIANLGVSIDVTTMELLVKLAVRIDYFKYPSIYLSYVNGIVGAMNVEQETLYKMYQLASALNRATIDRIFSFDASQSSKMSLIYSKVSNNFRPLTADEGVHMSPMYIVPSFLNSVFNATLTTANYLEGVTYIHTHVLFKDDIAMYQLTRSVAVIQPILSVLEGAQGVSSDQIKKIYNYTDDCMTRLSKRSFSDVASLGGDLDENTLWTLLTLAKKYDYFKQPLIYLGYQNGVVGPTALVQKTLYNIYEMASGQDQDFVMKAFALQSKNSDMTLGYWKVFNNFNLQPSQGYHFSPHYFVTSYLNRVYNATLSIADSLEGVKFIHQKVNLQDIPAMYGRTKEYIYDTAISTVLNAIQGVTVDDLVSMHNLSASDTNKLNSITFRQLDTELYIKIDVNTIETLLRLALRIGQLYVLPSE
jgi:hypothetical protein